MSKAIAPELFNTVINCDAEKRFQYLLNEVVQNLELWILTDDIGCVMLNTEDDDCVPVWPNKEFAQAWATDEWSECKPEAISLNKWYSRWTQGLQDDEIAIVIFPNQAEEGIVVYPEELETELKKITAKSARS
ncbi:DUF2750 domain-containing protein [Colwelliaceae bacterium 6471]